MSRKRIHALVSGRVQGVGFRYFVEREASALWLSGWVRNREDGGSVELVAEGDELNLVELEAALRRGPAYATVDEVDVSWSDDVEGLDGFEIRG